MAENAQAIFAVELDPNHVQAIVKAAVATMGDVAQVMVSAVSAVPNEAEV